MPQNPPLQMPICPGPEAAELATFMENGNADDKGLEVEMVRFAPFTDFQGSVVAYCSCPPNWNARLLINSA